MYKKSDITIKKVKMRSRIETLASLVGARGSHCLSESVSFIAAMENCQKRKPLQLLSADQIKKRERRGRRWLTNHGMGEKWSLSRSGRSNFYSERERGGGDGSFALLVWSVGFLRTWNIFINITLRFRLTINQSLYYFSFLKKERVA